MNGMGEVEDVVEAVSVRILDVVGEPVAEVDVVTSENYCSLCSTGTLKELDLKSPRKLFFDLIAVVEQGRVMLVIRPTANCLRCVANSSFPERDSGSGADGPQQ